MELYNTLTRKVEKFVPNKDGIVKLYTCGPTVYHFAHIGNLRSYIQEDVLEKYLKYVGYKVERVMNITDVGHLTGDSDDGSDKMVNSAKKENKSVLDIAKFYTEKYFEDCAKLNIKKPETVIPATSMIDEYIKIISKLINDGYAYEAGGNIYFDTSKLDDYYVLTNHKEEELMVGVRDDVEEDTNKKNKADFVLWFTKSKFDSQELKWDSPWGVGYPGWHIECSAISMKHLGEYLDIHCGGIDNAFPHHTNEIAQSESTFGHEWCRWWFHVYHLNTNSGKMSKSSGEFLTVSLLEERGYSPLVYRFLCLQSHYRKNLVFSWENLDNARIAYDKLVAKIATLKPEGEVDEEKFAEGKKRFTDALDNDLNTALAVTALYDVLKMDTNGATKLALITDFERVLSLGLIEAAEAIAKKNDEPSVDADFLKYINDMIEARRMAKKDKNFAEADRIRAELLEKGVTLLDTREGTKFTIEK